MAKYFDREVYPPVLTLVGDEVFIINQGGTNRTTDFDYVIDSLFVPLIENLKLKDFVDTTIVSPKLNEVLKYRNGYWVNESAGVATLDELSDVTVTNVSQGQTLLYNGTNWYNGNDPILNNYREYEHDIGPASGNYTIDLANGNVQRLFVTDVINVVLPELPEVGINWNFTLKVVYDGVNTPTFISNDATIKWLYGDDNLKLVGADSMNIYTFTSDVLSSEIYAHLVWSDNEAINVVET